MMNNEKLLTPIDVANHLQVNERTVTLWLRRGYLRGFKIGKEWRVSARDLDNFLEQNANVRSASSEASPRQERDSA